MKRFSTRVRPLVLAVIMSGVALVQVLSSAAADTPAAGDSKSLVPLKLDLPMPTLKGTPEALPKEPNIEPLSDKPPAAFMVPAGLTNVAFGKKVTSNVDPFSGELSQLTDGKKEASDDDAVEFKKGTLWVQVDLGASYKIYAVAVWHDHRYLQAFHDVILQASNDPKFKTGVTTLFNNDTDDSSGQGVGTDKEYFETRYGRVFDGKGVEARYVRSYAKGSSQSPLNAMQEIEVYAPPAK